MTAVSPLLPAWFGPSGLFADLSESSRQRLEGALVQEVFAPGAPIYVFQEAAEDVLYVVEGTARIFRPDGPDGVEVELNRVEAGRTIGEATFLARSPRTASVSALTEVCGARLPFSVLDEVLDNDPHSGRVYRRLATQLRATVTHGDDAQVKAAVELSLAAKLLVTVIAIQSGTLVATDLMKSAMQQVSSTTVMLVGYLLFITAIGVVYAFVTKLPRTDLGVTLTDWKPAVREAVVASAVVMGLTALAKWAIVSFIPEYGHVPVFDILDITGTHGRTNAEQLRVVALSAIAYTLAGGFQELYARGMLQGALYRITRPRFANPWPAILISNVLFASIHVAWSASLMVASFVGGLLWGWLYARRQTLLGVTLSHVVLGLWIGRILNLFAVFKFGPLSAG